MDSWAGSACYPRGSFYPLSHGPSTRCRGITRPAFRPCSARGPRSQAPFCPCTPRAVTIRPEGTVGRLRYALGGDRPSQTAHQPPSPARLTARGEVRTRRRVVFHRRLPGPREARLPGSHLSYAAPRAHRWQAAVKLHGVFLSCRGKGRIFTATSISPRPTSRQRPDRDAFRAGRNLPDKEFRYLRTVIVTAAVYRGFGSELAPLPLTFRHWAGISPHTSARALAGTCVCVKQSPGPGHCGPLGLGRPAAPPYRGAPSPEVTGAMLPSSLTSVTSST